MSKRLFLIIFCLALAGRLFAFSFAVFGDNRDGDETFKLLIAKVNKEQGLAFAFNTGDFAANGKENKYLAYREMISQLKIPLHNVMGNHDSANGGWKLFEKYFGSAYYSFDHQDSHFIILNNAFKDSFDADQFAWLKKDLAASEARHKFVFMHRPIFDPSELYKGYIMSGRQVGEELMALFRKYKVDYVFAGHIHGYAKAVRDSVTYIVTGGAGAPLYLPPELGGYYHYVIIDVGRKITDRSVRVYD